MRAFPLAVCLLVLAGCSETQQIGPVTQVSQAVVETDGFSLKLEVPEPNGGVPVMVIGFPLYYERLLADCRPEGAEFIFTDHRASAEGPAEFRADDFALVNLIDDIELLRKASGREKVVVLGHSGHSYLALEYAKRYPERTLGVVMIGISPTVGPEAVPLAEKYWEETATKERKAALAAAKEKWPDEAVWQMMPAEMIVADYTRNVPKNWYDFSFDPAWLWEGVPVNGEGFVQVWGTEFVKFDVAEGLEDLDVPVLLALGRWDYVVGPPELWDPILPKFRDVTVQVYEESGHSPCFEEPQRFREDLAEWLKSEGVL